MLYVIKLYTFNHIPASYCKLGFYCNYTERQNMNQLADRGIMSSMSTATMPGITYSSLEHHNPHGSLLLRIRLIIYLTI